MTDRLSHFSNSYFAYLNYRRPSASMGTNTFHSGSSRITDKFGMRYKWQILAIASCVIIAVTLGIGIYSATLYQNSSTATTDTTTTAVTTSRATTAASSTATTDSTADSGNTISSTTTTAIPTVAGDTTYAAVSTEVVSTKTPPICPSMLPFGDDAGDVKINSNIDVPFSHILWDKKTDGGFVSLSPKVATVLFQSKNTEQLRVNILFDAIFTEEWSTYYRNDSSKADKDAIACLVHNSQPVQALVVTASNNDMTELEAFQLIVASFEPSGTYIIRIYSKTLPESGVPDPVRITYYSSNDTYNYFTEDKVQDVAGRRQIFDVSKVIAKGQNLTVIEEGENCDVFIC